MRKELIDEFSVRDAAGEPFSLYVYQEIVYAGTFNDPNAEIRGLARIVTEEGDPVNDLENGKFLRVSTGETLTR